MRYIVILFCVFLSLSALSQTAEDALTLAENDVIGDARFVGTAGSMAAVGANLSSIPVNPASAAVFSNGYFGVSLNANMYDHSSTFYDSKSSESQMALAIPNFGVVLNMYESKETPLTKFNFAFTFNRMASFNKEMSFVGINNYSSVTEQMYEDFYANGSAISDLAYNTYLIDTNAAGEWSTAYGYSEISSPLYGQDQSQLIRDNGAKRKLGFTFGFEFYEKVLFGFNVSVDQFAYNRVNSIVETVPYSLETDFYSLEYIQDYTMTGLGYSASIGVLFKPIEALSFGGALHSSSIYSVHDEYNLSMESDFLSPRSDGYNLHSDEFNGEFYYNYSSPFRLVGNIAYIIKNIGFISFNYERVDYSKSSFESDEESMLFVNNEIKEYLRAVNNYRLGAEIRYGALAFRGGVGMSDLPTTTVNVADFNDNKIFYSGGIGIRGDNTFFDISFIRMNNNADNQHVLYQDGNFNNIKASYKEAETDIVLSFGVRF